LDYLVPKKEEINKLLQKGKKKIVRKENENRLKNSRKNLWSVKKKIREFVSVCAPNITFWIISAHLWD